jgi:hypothetical protein
MPDALAGRGLHDTLARRLLAELSAGTRLSLSYCVMKGAEAGYSPENVREVVDALVGEGLVTAQVPRCGLSSPILVAVSDALARYEQCRATGTGSAAGSPDPVSEPPLIA